MDSELDSENFAETRKFGAKQKWTDEEHKKLAEIIERLSVQDDPPGKIKWSSVAAELGNGRTSKQCRERWLNVRLDTKKGPWSLEEEARLATMHADVGPFWSVVGKDKVLRQRSENAIKNHWNAVMRCKTLAGRPPSLLTSYIGLIKAGWSAGKDTLALAERLLQVSISTTTTARDPDTRGPNLSRAMDIGATRGALAPHHHPDHVVQSMQGILTEPQPQAQPGALSPSGPSAGPSSRRMSGVEQYTASGTPEADADAGAAGLMSARSWPGNALHTAMESPASAPGGVGAQAAAPAQPQRSGRQPLTHGTLRLSSSVSDLQCKAHVDTGGPMPMDVEGMHASQGASPIAGTQPSEAASCAQSGALLLLLVEDDMERAWRGEGAVPVRAFPSMSGSSREEMHGPPAYGNGPRSDGARSMGAGMQAAGAAGPVRMQAAGGGIEWQRTSSLGAASLQAPSSRVPRTSRMRRHSVAAFGAQPAQTRRVRRASTAQVPSLDIPMTGSNPHADPYPGSARAPCPEPNSARSIREDTHAAQQPGRFTFLQSIADAPDQAGLFVPSQPGAARSDMPWALGPPAAPFPLAVPNPTTHTGAPLQTSPNSTAALKRPADTVQDASGILKGGKLARAWDAAGPWSAPAMHTDAALTSGVAAPTSHVISAHGPVSFPHSQPSMAGFRPPAMLGNLAPIGGGMESEEELLNEWEILLTDASNGQPGREAGVRGPAQLLRPPHAVPDGLMDVPEAGFMHIDAHLFSQAAERTTHPGPSHGLNNGAVAAELLRSTALSHDSVHDTSLHRPMSGLAVTARAPATAATTQRPPSCLATWAGDRPAAAPLQQQPATRAAVADAWGVGRPLQLQGPKSTPSAHSGLREPRSQSMACGTLLDSAAATATLAAADTSFSGWHGAAWAANGERIAAGSGLSRADWSWEPAADGATAATAAAAVAGAGAAAASARSQPAVAGSAADAAQPAWEGHNGFAIDSAHSDHLLDELLSALNAE